MGRPRAEPFSLTDAEISTLRARLADAGFDERGVVDACGLRDVADLKDLSPEAALAASEGDGPLSTLLRLFVVGGTARAAAVRGALHPLPVQRAVEGGLLSARGDDLRALVRMVPCEGALATFDSAGGGEPEAPDHVMGPSDSARRLWSLTPRGACDSALDLGSGSGFLALLLAKHAGRVAATDVNPRATAFARFNAALNGASNVECATGDLFAPVAARAFDRVVSNPPFVIAPEDRLIYLTGGMKADAFCQRVVSEAPSVLAEGGHLIMWCNWIEIEGTDWGERLRGWFSNTGCEAWVLRFSQVAPIDYAKAWMKVGQRHGAAEDPARLRAWLDYYAAENIAAIGAGAVIMRKRSGRSWFRAFDGPERVAVGAGESVLARLDALGFLETVRDDAALMRSVFAVSPDARLTQECQPTPRGWAQVASHVRLDRGLAYTEAIDLYLGELLGACDGARTLGQATAHVASRLGWDIEEIPQETPELVRQLVDEGFLVPR